MDSQTWIALAALIVSVGTGAINYIASLTKASREYAQTLKDEILDHEKRIKLLEKQLAECEDDREALRVDYYKTMKRLVDCEEKLDK